MLGGFWIAHVFRYKMDETFTMKNLLDAVDEGEKLIAQSDPS